MTSTESIPHVPIAATEVLDAKSLSLEQKSTICESIIAGRETTSAVAKRTGLKQDTLRKWIRLMRKGELIHESTGRPLKMSKIQQEEASSWALSSTSELTNKDWGNKLAEILQQSQKAVLTSDTVTCPTLELKKHQITFLKKKIMSVTKNVSTAALKSTDDAVDDE